MHVWMCVDVYLSAASRLCGLCVCAVSHANQNIALPCELVCVHVARLSCVCVSAAILSAYGTLRFFTSMSILFFPKFKNVFNSLTILVYLSVMAIGQYYGMQLLGKMKTMKDQAMKRQLTKLTMFIVRRLRPPIGCFAVCSVHCARQGRGTVPSGVGDPSKGAALVSTHTTHTHMRRFAVVLCAVVVMLLQVLENLVLIMLLVVFCIRTFFFTK